MKIHLAQSTLDCGAAFPGNAPPPGVDMGGVGWCPTVSQFRDQWDLTDPEVVWPDRPSFSWAERLMGGTELLHDGLVLLDQEGERANELFSEESAVREERVDAFRRQCDTVERSRPIASVGWYGLPGRFWDDPSSRNADWKRAHRLHEVYRYQKVMFTVAYWFDASPGYFEHVLSVGAAMARRYQRRWAVLVSPRRFGDAQPHESTVVSPDVLLSHWQMIANYLPDDLVLWSNESRYGFGRSIFEHENGRSPSEEECVAIERHGVAVLNAHINAMRALQDIHA